MLIDQGVREMDVCVMDFEGAGCCDLLDEKVTGALARPRPRGGRHHVSARGRSSVARVTRACDTAR